MIRATAGVRRRVARLYQKISADIVLIAAFFGMLWTLVHFTVNSTFAWEVFDETVNRMFSGRIGWNRVSWGPFPWQVRVLEPVLLDPMGTPVVHAREIHASIDLFALLDGALFIDGIVVKQPVMNLIQRPFDDPEKLRDSIFTIEEVFRPPVWLPDDGVPGAPPHLRFQVDRMEDVTYVQDIPGARLRVDEADIEGATFELAMHRPVPIRMGANHLDARSVDLEVGGLLPGSPTFRWHLTGVRAEGYRWPTTAMAGDGLDVARVDFRALGDAFRVEGFRLGLAGPGLPWIRGRVKATLADIAPHLAQFGVDFLHGPVTVRGEGQGEIDSFDGKAALEGPALSVYGVDLETWRVAASFHDNTVTVHDLHAGALGGRVRVQGAFAGESDRGHAFVQLEGVDVLKAPVALAPALHPLVGGRVSGRVGLRATFGGDVRASADADLVHDRGGPGPFGLAPRTDLQAMATFTDAGGQRTLLVHRLDVRPGPDHVTARGELDLTGRRLEASGAAEVAEIAHYLASFGVDLEGAVETRFRVRGPLDAPVVDATVSSPELRFGDFPPGAVTAEARYARERLTLDPAVVQGAGGQASVRGHVSLRPGTPLDLHVSARRIDLSTLPLGVDVGGRADADVVLSGPAARPRISGRATVRDPRWDRFAFTEVEVAGAFAGDAVTIETFRLADAAGDRAVVHGEISLREKRYRGEVRLVAIPLDWVNRFVDPPLPVRGQLDAALTGEGTFTDPQGQGQLRLRGVGYGAYEGGDADLQISADGQMVTLQGDLFGMATIDAAVPTVPGGPSARATLRFDGLALHERLPQLAKSGLDLRLSGLVEATADPFEPALEQVRVHLTEARLVTPQVTVQSDGDLRLSYRHGVVNLDQVQVETRGQRLGLSGTMGVAGDIDLRLVGDIDLGIIAPFLESTFTQVEGKASLAVDLQGNVLGQYIDVVPNGRVQIHRARLTPRSAVIGSELVLTEPAELVVAPPVMEGFGPALKPGTFDVRLGGTPRNPGRIVIRRDEGEIRVTDLRLTFDDFLPDQLYTALDATGARLVLPGTLRATVDARDLAIAITGLRDMTRGQFNVSGSVRLAHAEYLADHASTSDITSGVSENLTAVSRAQQVSVFERVPLLQRLYLQLDVEGENDIFIRNNVAVFELDLEIRPSIQLRGFLYPSQNTREEDLLTLEGSVETISETSKIVYASREFEVNSGRVDFGRGNFLEGALAASHTFRISTTGASSATNRFAAGGVGSYKEAEVILDVSFRMPNRNARPEIQLSLHSPSGAYSQTDLASLVATGHLPSDVSGAASAQPALELALNPVLGLIERPLQETLNLDRVDLTPVSTGTLLIEADKELSRRLRLYSYTPVGEAEGESTRRFGLEYRLNNFLFGDVNNERVGLLESTTGRLRLRLSFE